MGLVAVNFSAARKQTKTEPARKQESLSPYFSLKMIQTCKFTRRIERTRLAWRSNIVVVQTEIRGVTDIRAGHRIPGRGRGRGYGVPFSANYFFISKTKQEFQWFSMVCPLGIDDQACVYVTSLSFCFRLESHGWTLLNRWYWSRTRHWSVSIACKQTRLCLQVGYHPGQFTSNVKLNKNEIGDKSIQWNSSYLLELKWIIIDLIWLTWKLWCPLCLRTYSQGQGLYW